MAPSDAHEPATAPAPGPADVPGAFPDTLDNDDGDSSLSSGLQSISRALKARRSEYIRPRKLRVKIGTWNVAALPGTEDDVAYWFAKRAGRSPNLPSKPFGDRTNDIHARSGNTKNGLRRSGKAGSWVDQELAGCGSVQLAAGEPVSAGPGAAGADDIDIYVLGLQEIVDVSSPSESLKPYVDPAPSNRWKEAVRNALPPGYKMVASQQLVGLLLLIFASPSVAPTISSISSVGVGTGLMGYMGNKGGVATRIVVGGTTRLVFVNCHLAAGADKGSLDRRNWDVAQIINRTKFDPLDEEDILGDDGNTIGYEDFAFWFGDLNYRLDDIPGDDVRRLLHLHTGNKFRGTSSPRIPNENVPLSPSTQNSNGNSFASSDQLPINTISNSGFTEPLITLEDNSIIEPLLDPMSLETTLASLLPHDQLHRQQQTGKAFQDGWREGDISFLPTYKYDIGTTGTFDSSEKQRGPSWCDRILFRSRHDFLEYKRKVKEAEEAKKRDEEMKALGLGQGEEDDNVLFDYDPDLDGANDYDENEDTVEPSSAPHSSQLEHIDTIQMTYYTSHQEIVSSDHKPLDAEFVLSFDAVDPGLKAKVHQEVVRELDKAENENRPGVTIVVENQPEDSREDYQTSSLANDPNAVNFGQVRYDVPVSRNVTIANTSGAPATFGFYYSPSDNGGESVATPSWLHLRVDGNPDADAQHPKSRPEYTLQPGDTINVQLILCIYDINYVRELNNGEAQIEDVLILQVTNGRDYFIPVHATWIPTCFGFSLDELTRMPEDGARQLDIKAQPLRSSENHDKQGTRVSAPRELFRLTEAIADLTERAVAEWGQVGDNNFENNPPPWDTEKGGWPFEEQTWGFTNNHERYHLLSRVRDALDTNSPLTSIFPPELRSQNRVELLAETLLSFLKSIRGGMITAPLWHELEQIVISNEKSKSPPSTEQSQSRILEALSSSPAHSVSFTFLTFMLNRITNEIAPLSTPAAQTTPTSPTTPLETPSISTASLPGSPSSTPVSPSSATSSSATASPPLSINPLSRTFSIRRGNPLNYSSSAGTHTDTTGAPAAAAATVGAKPTTASARRQAVKKVFTKIFAETIFSSDIPRPEKDKERRLCEERRRRVLEPFLE
ncbi:phosphatase [Blastomyces gilchristii SLH14081]|uniref:Phosphatase n=1 Tax=Blastomyces gilchristii (strain SLH14081) TaxID=559298 RepID=A0A179UYN5_BLAGS|nr:phosphatase [Blastomyces gilchristii SLH14081]OAT13205.1 phosphatase [Blastomyces gilchristii SLH14081]